MQRFYFITILGLIILVGSFGLAILGIIDDSETALVSYSYLWVPVLACGLGGMFAEKRKFKNATAVAIIIGLASVMILGGFYEGIWPLL